MSAEADHNDDSRPGASDGPQVLSGLRVLDLSRWVAGEFATKLFADFGADVIKVEKPGEGSYTRHWGPFPGDNPNIEASALFLHLNINKRRVTLTCLPDGPGPAAAPGSDRGRGRRVVPARHLERLGLGPAELQPARPPAGGYQDHRVRPGRPVPGLRGDRHRAAGDGRSDERDGRASPGRSASRACWSTTQSAAPRARRAWAASYAARRATVRGGGDRRLRAGGPAGRCGPARVLPADGRVLGRERAAGRSQRARGAATFTGAVPGQRRLRHGLHHQPGFWTRLVGWSREGNEAFRQVTWSRQILGEDWDEFIPTWCGMVRRPAEDRDHGTRRGHAHTTHRFPRRSELHGERALPRPRLLRRRDPPGGGDAGVHRAAVADARWLPAAAHRAAARPDTADPGRRGSAPAGRTAGVRAQGGIRRRSCRIHSKASGWSI